MEEKIRILHVFGVLNRGGAETMLMNIYRNLDRRKYSFDFVVHGTDIGVYEEEIQNMGGKIFRVPRYNGLNYLQYKNSWVNLLKTIPTDTIIHSHIRNSAVIYLKKAKEFGFRTILHSHNTSSGSGLVSLYKDYMLKAAPKYSDVNVSCGIEAGEWLFGKDGNFMVIPNAVNIDEFKFNTFKREETRKKLGLKDEIALVSVARFNTQKNLPFLLEVFSNLLQNSKKYKLFLVGDGEMREELEKIINLKNLQEDVTLLGIRGDVSDILMATDLFLMPSLHEGLPLSLIEAQVTGINILVSNTITKEVNVSGKIEYLAISHIDPWIKKITELKLNSASERAEYYKLMRETSYEISKSTKLLENLYLEF